MRGITPVSDTPSQDSNATLCHGFRCALGILAIVLSDHDRLLVRRGYEDGVSSLVKLTWDIFGKQVTAKTTL
jgi:hypothetical protein